MGLGASNIQSHSLPNLHISVPNRPDEGPKSPVTSSGDGTTLDRNRVPGATRLRNKWLNQMTGTHPLVAEHHKQISELKKQSPHKEIRKEYDAILGHGEKLNNVLKENPPNNRDRRLLEIHEDLGNHYAKIQNKLTSEDQKKLQPIIDRNEEIKRRLADCINSSPASPGGMHGVQGGTQGLMHENSANMQNMMAQQSNMQAQGQVEMTAQAGLEMQKNLLTMMLENQLSAVKICSQINKMGCEGACAAISS